MSENRRNLWVGLFVLVGLTMLCVLMVFFGEAPSFLRSKEYRVAVHVHNLGGISPGTPVYMNGVPVGRVGGVRFIDLNHPDEGVFVDTYIGIYYPIPNTARATIKPAGLGLGQGDITLTVPRGISAPPLPNDGTAEIPGEMGHPLGDIFPKETFDALQTTVTQLGDFAHELTPVAKDLHDLLQRRTVEDVDAAAPGRVAANIATVVQRFDRTIKNVNDVIGDPEVQKGLRGAVANVRDSSVELKAAAADFRSFAANLKTDESRVADKLEAGVDQFRSTAETALSMIASMSQVATNLEHASRDLSEGKGTLGLLLRDPRVYEAINLSFARITELVDTLRRITGGWERKGYVDLAVHETAVGTVRTKRPLPGQ